MVDVPDYWQARWGTSNTFEWARHARLSPLNQAPSVRFNSNCTVNEKSKTSTSGIAHFSSRYYPTSQQALTSRRRTEPSACTTNIEIGQPEVRMGEYAKPVAEVCWLQMQSILKSHSFPTETDSFGPHNILLWFDYRKLHQNPCTVVTLLLRHPCFFPPNGTLLLATLVRPINFRGASKQETVLESNKIAIEITIRRTWTIYQTNRAAAVPKIKRG